MNPQVTQQVEKLIATGHQGIDGTWHVFTDARNTETRKCSKTEAAFLEALRNLEVETWRKAV